MTVKLAMKGIWIGRLGTRLLGFLMLLAVLTAFATAQDFPMFKGDPARTGKNNAPNTAGPGKALLHWYRPNASDSIGQTQTIDNTFMPTINPTPPPPVGPDYVQGIGIWNDPDPNNEASGPFLPTDTLNPQAGVTYAVSTTVTAGGAGTTQNLASTSGISAGETLHFVTANVDAVVASVPSSTSVVLTTSVSSTTGEVVNDTSPRPDFLMANAIASAAGDPRIPANPADTLSTFTWSLRNTVTPFYNSQSYALYVHIPTGPSQIPGGPQQFPQEDFVYQIDSANGSEIQIVNTGVSGFGWVRLGHTPAGDALYTCNGVNPIKITLFNTIPRDNATGVLTSDPTGNFVVYADAVRAVPAIGFYAATPVVSSFAPGPQIRTVAALNQLIPGHHDVSTTVVLGANSNIQNLMSTVNMNVGDLLSFGTPTAASARIQLIPDLTHVQLASSVYTTDGEDVVDSTALDPSLSKNIKAVVTSYDFDTGLRRWTFSPLLESTSAFEEDDNSVNIQQTGTSWTFSPPGTTPPPNFRGADYATHAISNAGVDSTFEYRTTTPTGSNLLNPGSYEIYAWIPGDGGSATFAHALQYEVFEGSTMTTVTVDQSVSSGWLKIGTRSFLHDPAHSNDLKLVVTDFSADPTDVAPRTAFTDAVRFVGPTDLEVTSTPVQMTVPIKDNTGALVDTPVVIIAAENGVIYCLDANGNGDGTTHLIWTYPSTPDPDVAPGTWKDPNLNAPTGAIPDGGADGVNNQLMAEMPGHFNLSSASVVPVGTHDYLYIGDQKGRVYCIDTAGRGDYNFATGRPGTTTRIWSYPDDWPATTAAKSTLGAIDGSVAVASNTAGVTAFVPTRSGRMIALAGDATFPPPASHTTTVRWQYPVTATSSLPPVETTPAVDFNQVFFGTAPLDGSAGQFIGVNWDTGVQTWAIGSPSKAFSSFFGGPATVSSITLGGSMPDSVFVSNSNGGVYALDATSGAIQWESYDLTAPVEAPLTYSMISVYDNTHTAQNPTPIIIAPEDDGEVGLLTAVTSNLNSVGTRLAGGFGTQSNSLTDSVAVGDGFMYFGDNEGYLYALSDTAGSFPGVTPPLTTIESPNNPSSPDYANAQIRLVTKNAYLQLRQGTMYYADSIDPSNQIVRNPMAFEWGETIYLLVYGFPYERAGTTVPPVVNVNFSVGGETVRNVFTEAHIYQGVSNPPGSGVDPDPLYPKFSPANPYSGYAILSFTIQGAGANALPPGPGQITIGFNTVDTSGAPINYPASSKSVIYVANPLGLDIPSPNSTFDQKIGYTNQTSDPQNLSNGSSSVPNLLGTVGDVTHGQSANLAVGVVDRSLVELIRGPGRGLQNVRVERADLAWQNGTGPGAGPASPGAGTPLNPIDPVLFPNFEDLPGNFPNNSLDYPDIGREQVTVTESKNGSTANPVNYPVELIGPTAADGTLMTDANSSTRAVLATPFDFTVNVPKYQPPNQLLGSNFYSMSPDVPAGYMGTYYVFVDSSGNGLLDRPNSVIQTDSQAPSQTREAYRNFAYAGAVTPDERIDVQTPTVDLGSLAEGTGYTPAAPGPGNALFSPWTGGYTALFKSFDVANDGNVNLLNLRLAKSTTADDTTLDPWQILSPANEDLAYLSGTLDFWTDMDPGYAPTKDISPDAPVILQKSRVGDRSSRKLTPNPVARVNGNLGLTTDTPRLPAATYPVASPRVAATVPFGFPVGTYTGIMRVIEDTDTTGQVKNGSNAYTMPGTNPASMSQDLNPDGSLIEVNSDPSLKVVLKVRESRASSASTPMTAPFIDSLGTGAETFRYSNLQPSGFRNPTNGSLVTAFSSDRNTWTPPLPSTLTAPVANPWRIFVASVQGTDPATAPGTSPLRDLYGFAPDTANGRWFQQSGQTSNGFPDPSLDGNIWGPNLVGGTASYGSPVFPADGMLNPFRDVATAGMGTPLPNTLMAFVGDAQIQEGSGQRAQSKIFVSPVTVDSSGSVGMGNIYAMTNDPNAKKSRPSIVQTQTGFILFYSATVGGRSSIYYVLPSGTAGASQYDGSYFTDSAAIDVGNGFDSVSAPNVVGRVYRGASPPDPKYSTNILEMTFVGKLRDRPTSELYYGRIYLDASTQVPALLAPLPLRTQEPLQASATAGTYLALGVQWVPNATVALQSLTGTTYTDLEVPSTKIVDRDTGIITFDTKLGGKAYIDPSNGSVRLTGAMPPHSSTLVLTYQPRFLRISEGTTAGYASPNLAVDERVIPDISYWRKPDNSQVDGTDMVRPGRFIFTYGRAAAGAGQAARPTMKTLRFGVDLPLPVFTNPDGSTGLVTVSGLGPNGYYQIDPAKKKIYVTPTDEDQSVTISYEAADGGTGADLGPRTVGPINVSLITERPEELVPLDQASNEANVSMFLDPFDYMNPRRPGLIWLFWASTRSGAPDVYMQTIAPRFTPVVTGK